MDFSKYLKIKKILRSKTYLILFFLLVFKLAEATHIVGGEIYYDNLGGNNYRIHMKVYRDCINGVPPFDGFPDNLGNVTPAYFTVFDAFNNPIISSSFTPLSFSTVPPTSNNPCAPNTANTACVQEALYEAFVNLPPASGGYYVVYQRCCRNNTILNLVNPGNVGATYWQHIPGPEVVAVNSSPRFTKRPPIYICKGNPIAFDHAASDPDGDSLVYSLCDPYNGLDACCPIVNTSTPLPSSQCPNPPSSCPSINTPQPYIGVPFASPYNSGYPMASNPVINIDPVTGFLNGNPTIQGQWVVGVCVSEYRQGQLIDVHHRDFQFNVIPCPFVISPQVVAQTTTNNGQGTGYCNGFTVLFQNATSNASWYHWDFGVTTLTNDTSNLVNPTYIYPGAGDYTVTLYANPGALCDTVVTTVVHINPLLLPSYITPTAQCFNGNSFNFNGGGQFQGTGSFNWNFGSNANPTSASTSSVSNVVFDTPGSYPVVYTVSENGCTASATKTIEVWQNPVASVAAFPSVGCDPVAITFSNTSTAGSAMSVLWTFSDGTTSTALNPSHVFTPAGIYGFSLSIITSQKCIDTSKVIAANSISVTTTPIADFNFVSATGLCFNNHNLSFTSTSQQLSPGGVLAWSFGPSASTQVSSSQSISNVTYGDPGLYPVTLIATDNNCADTVTKTIELYENPVALISPVTLIGCDPMSVSFVNTSTAASALNYLWTFSDGSTSTQENPIHVFTPPGTYDYTLTIKATSKCIDTSQAFSVSSITVNPSPIASFTATPMVTTIFDPDIFFFNTSLSTNVLSWLYDFDDGSSSSDVNPIHTYTTWGDYYATQTIVNNYACPNTTTLLIRVLPEFRFWIPNAFTPSNKDDLNDIFKPIVIGVSDYTFAIFDRWGSLIYKTNDAEAGWNGTYKNKPCTDDVYVWKCEFKNIVSKENESHVGHVMLVR